MGFEYLRRLGRIVKLYGIADDRYPIDGTVRAVASDDSSVNCSAFEHEGAQVKRGDRCPSEQSPKDTSIRRVVPGRELNDIVRVAVDFENGQAFIARTMQEGQCGLKRPSNASGAALALVVRNERDFLHGYDFAIRTTPAPTSSHGGCLQPVTGKEMLFEQPALSRRQS
jgi:hypothetical protein